MSIKVDFRSTSGHFRSISGGILPSGGELISTTLETLATLCTWAAFLSTAGLTRKFVINSEIGQRCNRRLNWLAAGAPASRRPPSLIQLASIEFDFQSVSASDVKFQ